MKTEREKSEMAQKHRFKKEREFKKRVSEETENEDADIRSFQFHSHRLEDFEKRRNEIRRGVGAGRRNDEGDDRKGGRSFGGKRSGDREDRDNKRGGFKGDRRGGKDFGGKRDGKRFEKGDKRGGFKGDRRGGKDFGGKRGSKPSFDTDFDDED